MKRWIILCAMLISSVTVLAQNRNTDIDTQKNNVSATSGMDNEFVLKAGQAGRAEVMLGNLAESRGAAKAVKDYGAMMVMDHQKANDELITLAARKRYMTVAKELPADMQKDYEKLSAKSGTDFDQAFMEQMIKDHEKVIKLFRQESENGKDPDLRNWASRTLPKLEQHLQHAREVHQQVKDYKKMTEGNKDK